MYIDSHQHFWKLARGDYSWMSSEYKPLYKDFFPSDLKPLIKEKNISKTIIVQAAVTVAETEFTLIIQNNPGSSIALEAQYYTRSRILSRTDVE